VAAYLNGPLAFLPLAPLTNEAVADARPVVARIMQRLRAEATQDEAAKMETETFVLMGLRYAPEFARQLFDEVREMEDSTTYQWIMSKGEARGAIRILLRLGRHKFGEPDPQTVQAIENISDIDRLQTLSERVLDVSSWQELLSTP
jgi:hypothetical protein